MDVWLDKYGRVVSLGGFQRPARKLPMVDVRDHPYYKCPYRAADNIVITENAWGNEFTRNGYSIHSQLFYEDDKRIESYRIAEVFYKWAHSDNGRLLATRVHYDKPMTVLEHIKQRNNRIEMEKDLKDKKTSL